MKSVKYIVWVGSYPWSENLPANYRMTVLSSKDKTEFCRTTANKHLRDMKQKGYSGYLEKVT